MTDGAVAGLSTVVPFAGAFAPLRVLRNLDGPARRALLADLRSSGLGMLLTEGLEVPSRVADDVRASGLRLAGGLSCFSDHAGHFRRVPDELRPIISSGAQRPPMEWYRGIIPTDQAYEDDLVAACRAAASDPDLCLFALDFIRWPIHWELELRDGTTPLDSSFDSTTLSRFRDEMEVDVPVDDGPAAAERIRTSLESEWTAFKCRVISAIVERIVDEIRSIRPDLSIGVFLVPGDDLQRRRHAGQDVADIGRVVDLLLPMTYHAILRRPPEWVGDVVADIRGRSPAPVVPVIQATADPDVAGDSDWGEPFPSEALGRAIDAARAAGGSGFVVFPAHGLDRARAAEVHRRTAAR